MATQVIPALQAELDQISKQVPAPVSERIEGAIGAIEASGTAPGLSVGDQAPDFTLPDPLGRPVSLRGRLVAGPAVLVFYRGQWCPFCNAHLRALQKALPEIKAAGASLLAIGPRRHTADGSRRLPVPATFVLDSTGVVRAAHVSADFRTRMEPAAIIAALVACQRVRR